MRMLFMIFTIAERSFKILELPTATTLLLRRQCHNYGYDYISPTHIELSREATRLVIRRLQRTVLRLIRDPDFSMSAEANPETEKETQDSPFAANRKTGPTAGAGKQDSNCRTCNDFKSWSKQQRLISNVQSSKVK